MQPVMQPLRTNVCDVCGGFATQAAAQSLAAAAAQPAAAAAEAAVPAASTAGASPEPISGLRLRRAL